MRIPSIIFAAALLAALPAMAGEEAPWEGDLRQQAGDKLGCQVEYLLNVRSGTIAGKPTVEARVQCSDGRRFDAYRVEPETDFQFHACDTQTC
ncbi:MAG: hypothetical protein KDJ74_14525 [Notoacmeibacter sp.]|nr:hypothetical protein [Notoacmeibacter sp.]